MSEKKIENSIKKYLTESGIYYFKVHGSAFMPPGIPDIVACYEGYFIGIEVKDRGLKYTQSDAQKVHEENIKKAGGEYFLVDSLEECIWRLDEFINSKRYY